MQYFVLHKSTLSWRNHEIYAQLDRRQWTVEDQDRLWKASPVTPAHSSFEFAVSPHAPKPDRLGTGSYVELYSHRLVACIREAGVRFETFPATLVDRKTKQPLEDQEHVVFHLMEVHPAIDWQKSDADEVTQAIRRLVLSDKCLNDQPFLFRDQIRRELVFIHSSLKERFEELAISGFEYTPVEKYQFEGFPWMAKNRHRPKLP